MPDHPRFIKIYGLERSGTNYLTWAMCRAYSDVCVLVDETGWKHGEIPTNVDWTGGDWSDPAWPEPARRRHAALRLRRLGASLASLKEAAEDGLAICAIVKDPYAWVSSFSHYRGVPCSPVRVDMILRWNRVNRQYVDYVMRKPSLAAIVRYEDLLLNARSALEEVAARFGFIRSGCARLTTNFQMNFFAGSSGRAFDREKYSKKVYMKNYSKTDMEIFYKHLDVELCSRLSYLVYDSTFSGISVVGRGSL